MEYVKEITYDPRFQSIIMAGSTQEGKTTHAISYSKMLSMKGHNILILDKKRKFTKVDPLKVIHSLVEITGEGLQIMQPNKFSSPEQMHQFFEDISWIAYSYKNLIFVIDELHSWFKDIRTHIPSFELFCRECHNQECSYIAIFQSPSEVPSYVMRNSHHRFVLYLDLEQDVKAMKKVIGKEMNLFSQSQIQNMTDFTKKKVNL